MTNDPVMKRMNDEMLMMNDEINLGVIVWLHHASHTTHSSHTATTHWHGGFLLGDFGDDRFRSGQ